MAAAPGRNPKVGESHWLDDPPDVACNDSTGQYAVDGLAAVL